jgi:hypothetical protein
MMLAEKDRNFLRLVIRSPDRGDGWRSVSSHCWPLVEAFTAEELLEVDAEGGRVRLTEKGMTVAEYLV